MVTVLGFCDKINSGIAPPKVLFVREFAPEPNIGKLVGVERIRPQVGLHEPFETVAFILLGERNGAVFFQDLVETHGRRTCCLEGVVGRLIANDGYRIPKR